MGKKAKATTQTEIIAFDNNGNEFSALYAAEAWLGENGYSYAPRSWSTWAES